ncbi:MAG: PDZ domain-containing protein [Bdellovibrionota bacterium]
MNKLHITFLLSFMAFVGCSSNPPEPNYEVRADHQFKVSVYSDGREVKDFNAPLVHRVDLTAAQLAQIGGTPMKLPFQASSEKDGLGKVSGVRVLRPKAGDNPSMLGLQEKDLVTAVGTVRVKSVDDFRTLFDQLRGSKSASITVERQGKPHKILYYLSQS